MHKECLVTDGQVVGIVVDEFSRYDGPRFYQPLLQQGRLQPLFPQVSQDQILDILNVSLEHGRYLRRRFCSRVMRLTEFGPDGRG